MQQFIVPQFIEVEDKILGPITTRQFLILLVVGIVVFLAYRFGDLAVFVTFLVVFGGTGLILAFVKINGQAFHYFLLNIIQSIRRPSRRVWHKLLSKKELDILRKAQPPETTPPTTRLQVKRQRISDLALLVNTGGFYHPEGEDDIL